MFDELTYRLLLALVRKRYGGSPLSHLRDRKAEMVGEFYPQLAPALARLRAFPNLTLVDVTAADLARMSDILPRDALHLSAMQACDCFDLVSHDADFDRVPMVHRYTL